MHEPLFELRVLAIAERAVDRQSRRIVGSNVEHHRVHGPEQLGSDGAGDDLFKQGFTTKDAATGSGLGLFISKRILDRHEGTITAANGTAGGAEFTVTLPANRSAEDRVAG